MRNAAIASIGLIIFIAVMLAFKFLIIPPFVQTYGIVGVVAFISTMLAIAFWMEKKEQPQSPPTSPQYSEEELRAWARKIGDDLGRPKTEKIIDAEFTVVNEAKAQTTSPQSSPSSTIVGFAIIAGALVFAGAIFLSSSKMDSTNKPSSDTKLQVNGLDANTNAYLRSLRDGKTSEK